MASKRLSGLLMVALIIALCVPQPMANANGLVAAGVNLTVLSKRAMDAKKVLEAAKYTQEVWTQLSSESIVVTEPVISPQPAAWRNNNLYVGDKVEVTVKWTAKYSPSLVQSIANLSALDDRCGFTRLEAFNNGKKILTVDSKCEREFKNEFTQTFTLEAVDVSEPDAANLEVKASVYFQTRNWWDTGNFNGWEFTSDGSVTKSTAVDFIVKYPFSAPVTYQPAPQIVQHGRKLSRTLDIVYFSTGVGFVMDGQINSGYSQEFVWPQVATHRPRPASQSGGLAEGYVTDPDSKHCAEGSKKSKQFSVPYHVKNFGVALESGNVWKADDIIAKPIKDTCVCLASDVDGVPVNDDLETGMREQPVEKMSNEVSVVGKIKYPISSALSGLVVKVRDATGGPVYEARPDLKGEFAVRGQFKSREVRVEVSGPTLETVSVKRTLLKIVEDESAKGSALEVQSILAQLATGVFMMQTSKEAKPNRRTKESPNAPVRQQSLSLSQLTLGTLALFPRPISDVQVTVKSESGEPVPAAIWAGSDEKNRTLLAVTDGKKILSLSPNSFDVLSFPIAKITVVPLARFDRKFSQKQLNVSMDLNKTEGKLKLGNLVFTEVKPAKDTFNLKAKFIDVKQKPIAGVKVSLVDPEGLTLAQGTSGKDGSVTISGQRGRQRFVIEGAQPNQKIESELAELGRSGDIDLGTMTFIPQKVKYAAAGGGR